ncbi:unnamed protein product, partial [Mesorhabditis belari]|uniref:Uncharacterized protein n=1 Tax=Mesorhabditis belari TaxID=2138241 RepID=A0AAF3EI25_9BILA
MSAHPNLNMFAAGHDNGNCCFQDSNVKVPPYCVSDNLVFCTPGDKTIHRRDMKATGKDQAFGKLSWWGCSCNSYYALHYNAAGKLLYLRHAYTIGTKIYDVYKLEPDCCYLEMMKGSIYLMCSKNE